MAKKKNGFPSVQKSPQPKSNLNSVELTNHFKPVRDPDTNICYVTHEIKDETGEVVKVESIPLDSESGQVLIRSKVSEMLGDTFAEYDLKHANDVLRGKALSQLPRKPINPVEAGSAGGQARGPGKRPRPSFQEFVKVLDEEGVVASLDFQGRARVEFPRDGENGLPQSWILEDKRVHAGLFRMYVAEYGVPPSSAELRDIIEWLRSEAYAWGMGEPADEAAVHTLDDNAIFIAVRQYCRDLRKAGEKRADRATDAYREMTALGKELQVDMKGWPERASDLSAKLKLSPELLDRLELRFTSRHERDGSRWTFERVVKEQPPTQPTTVGSKQSEDDDLVA